jgi:hypothetical protein
MQPGGGALNAQEGGPNLYYVQAPWSGETLARPYGSFSKLLDQSRWFWVLLHPVYKERFCSVLAEFLCLRQSEHILPFRPPKPNQVCKPLFYLGPNPAVTYQFTRHFPKSLHNLLGTAG